MAQIAPVKRDLIHQAFMEAFADYAMDASGTPEERLLLRVRKNAVDYDLSPGLYDGDRLVGFTLIGIDDWGGARSAYDAGTGIVPAFRKHGWAKRMFDHACPALRERGVERFVLEVLQQNEPAIKAYQKSGFAIARELRCYAIETEKLAGLPHPAAIEVRPIDRTTFAALEASADWIPSFENRFSALEAIPEHVELTGAFVDGALAGGCAYSPALHWLLALLVDRGRRRRGVGTALMRHLGTTLVGSHPRLTALNVDGEDLGTQSFFGAVGFEPLVDQFEMTRAL